MDRDVRDVPLTAADPRAVTGYEAALTQFQTYVGDPIDTLDRTLAEAPDFVMGHLFKALAIITTGEKQFLPAAQSAFADAAHHAGPRRAGDRPAPDRAAGSPHPSRHPGNCASRSSARVRGR